MVLSTYRIYVGYPITKRKNSPIHFSSAEVKLLNSGKRRNWLNNVRKIISATFHLFLFSV